MLRNLYYLTRKVAIYIVMHLSVQLNKPFFRKLCREASAKHLSSENCCLLNTASSSVFENPISFHLVHNYVIKLIVKSLYSPTLRYAYCFSREAQHNAAPCGRIQLF